MKHLNKKKINEQLAEVLVPHGFKRRGSAFFRIIGDGVFQVVQFEYERVMEDFLLYVGLFSLYDKLEEQWFTSSGCIPRYFVGDFSDVRYPIINEVKNGITYDRKVSTEEQIKILQDKGVSWLNNIQTQEQLVEGICWLDKKEGNTIWWNDDLKIGPFLASGQTKKAAHVVSAILKQHMAGGPQNHPASKIFWSDYTWDEKMIREYERCFPGKDEEFLSLHRMMNRNDEEEIRAYLMKNYEQNMQYAAFCKKK